MQNINIQRKSSHMLRNHFHFFYENVDISRKSGPQGYPGAVRVDPRPTLGLFASYNKTFRGLLSGNKLAHFNENRSHLEEKWPHLHEQLRYVYEK